MAKAQTNIAASVRQRLLNAARHDGQVFDVVLVSFALERLIYRLSISPYRDRFVLKGGMLVTLWTANSGRFTRDIDFLGFGESNSATLKQVFATILDIQADDGLDFDVAQLTTTDIREANSYGGIRLKTTASLGPTRIPITIDIGFGDAVMDTDYTVTYPSLLDFPTGTIRAYSPATVMAEKFQALVALGVANGRMKDFYDLWQIPQSIQVDPTGLRHAIKETFARRKTAVPMICPDGLTDAFAQDPQKKQQWRAFANSIDLPDVALSHVTNSIWGMLGPICDSLRDT